MEARLLKRRVLIILLVMVLALLSSCNSNNESTIAKEIEPEHKHEDFLYDSKISWNSSYTDLITLYGNPDAFSENVGGDELRVHYYNPQVAGYTFDKIIFHFDRSTGHITLIEICSNELFTDSVTEETKRINKAIEDEMIEKYGTNYTKTNSAYYEWKYAYAETQIWFYTAGKDYGRQIKIFYKNTHDYSNEKAFTDLPKSIP